MKQKPVGIKNTIKSWFVKKPKSPMAMVWLHIHQDKDYGVIGHCIFNRNEAVKGYDSYGTNGHK